jgi:hypothetical protein
MREERSPCDRQGRPQYKIACCLLKEEIAKKEDGHPRTGGIQMATEGLDSGLHRRDEFLGVH